MKLMARVLLLDIDSTVPNLALMKLSTWHKAQGDEVRLRRMGKPDIVYASCVFTWGQKLLSQVREIYPGVTEGGPGVALASRLPGPVDDMPPDYSLYPWSRLKTLGFHKPFALGYLTKGCPRRCEFCVAWRLEPEHHQVSTVDRLLRRDTEFLILLDDNFLANEGLALELLAEMQEEKVQVCFAQGLDIRHVTEALSESLARTAFWNLHHTRRQLTIAFDSPQIVGAWTKGVKRLLEAGIKAWQIQSFFLVGFDTAFEQDVERLNIMRDHGVDPFCMVYKGREKETRRADDPRLHHFSRWVNRRLYRSCDFEQYTRWARENQQLPLPMEV